MSKKVFKEKKFNLGIVESYKKNTEADSPVLGSFTVKGMTVENMVSQNKTKYAPEVWAQKTAFGQGGKFLDENGKLKPSTLFGSVDHPIDNRAELLLQEAAIAWYDVNRNENGSWDGSAHILNNPQGRIVKTFLDYAKQFGGGDLLGVSSRALGESMVSEANGEQVEAIVPDSFELMSFDFVYNPSFQTAVAHLNESSKTKKNVLVESVRALAKDDEDHADVYKNFADKIETINKEIIEMKKEETKLEANTLSKAKQNYLKELRMQEKKLHDALYELKMMTDEEFADKKEGDKGKLMKVIKKEHDEVVAEIESLENQAMQTEAKEEDAAEVITEEVVEETTEEVVKEAKGSITDRLFKLISEMVTEEDIDLESLEKFVLGEVDENASTRRTIANIVNDGDPIRIAAGIVFIYDLLKGNAMDDGEDFKDYWTYSVKWPFTEEQTEEARKLALKEEYDLIYIVPDGLKIYESKKSTTQVKVVKEAEELDEEELEEIGEEMAEELSEEKEEEVELEEEQPEEQPEEEMAEEFDLATLKTELDDLKAMLQEIKDILMPIEAPELELDEMPADEEEQPEEDMADEEAEELGDQADELDMLDEEDLEELSDEELEYLAGLDL